MPKATSTKMSSAEELLFSSLPDPILTQNAETVLTKRYLHRDINGNIKENFKELFYRIARTAASVEKTKDKQHMWLKKFYIEMAVNGTFMPNSPNIMNAGLKDGCLNACYVIDIPDSVEGIYDAIKDVALITKAGGGVGMTFSNLRPKRDIIASSGTETSGPMPFIEAVNIGCSAIQQGSRRRGALMGTMSIHHPDIIEFITVKQDLTKLTNFNLSLTVTDDYMNALIYCMNNDEDRSHIFINPRNDEAREIENPDTKEAWTVKELWALIIKCAHTTGEPGLLFIDRANAENPVPNIGSYQTTNPCFVGSTPVAMPNVEGGSKTFKELADDGVDVDVYSKDDNGNLVIKKMLNPRMTAKQQKICRIHLDSGDYLDQTLDHEYELKNGKIVKAKDLQPNDSLGIMTTYNTNLDELIHNKPTDIIHKNKLYPFISNSRTSDFVHRLVAEKKYGDLFGKVVHHIDNNSFNNHPDNLEVMTKEEHDKHHGKEIQGENNPMHYAKHNWSKQQWNDYKGVSSPSVDCTGHNNGACMDVSNDEIQIEAVKFAKKLGRQFTCEEWTHAAKKLSLPVVDARFRLGKYKNQSDYAKGIAEIAGVPTFKTHVCLRNYILAEKQGYTVVVKDGYTFVKKICEICEIEFQVPYTRREVCMCSEGCNVEYAANKYNDMKFKIGKVEYFDWLKEDGCRPKYWKEAKELAGLLNHRVVSVEILDELQDVYNGTVEDTHNLYVGGFITTDKFGREAKQYINTVQCGEQYLISQTADKDNPIGDVCNLGSIDISKYVNDKNEFDWALFERSIGIATRFLDNTIDSSSYPLPKIEKVAKQIRRIGLGIMGFADALFKLKLKYGSAASFKFAQGIMEILTQASVDTSIKLAKEKGEFPAFKESAINQKTMNLIGMKKVKPLRNCNTTTIAPTGTISILADCSGGIEPMFSLAFERHVMNGEVLIEVNKHFKKALEDEGIFSEDILRKVMEQGSLQNIDEIPQHIKDVFVSARDVEPADHIRMQAAAQKFCHSSISKTINLPEEATQDLVAEAYILAYKTGCKGTTVYRDNCRNAQPMALSKKKEEPKEVQVKKVGLITIPEIVDAVKIKQRTPFGNMHVKVSHIDKKPLEVFAQLGKGGDIANSDLESICRVVSVYLRSGGDLSLIIDQLKGIGSSLSIPTKDGRVSSLGDALSIALGKYLDYVNVDSERVVRAQQTSHEEIYKIQCPECDGYLNIEEGCKKCLSCGYSAC